MGITRATGRERSAWVGAVMALGVSGILLVRILAIGKPGVVVILMPAIAGGALALRRSSSRIAAGVAAGLVSATAAVLLIGWVGVAYVPSIALFVAAAVRRERVRTVT